MEYDKEPCNHSHSTRAQVCAVSALCVVSLNVAMMIGMPVQVIGGLRAPVESNDTLHLTEEQASWFGGLGFIVQPLGGVFAGLSQEVMGRKTCLILGILPELVGWLTLYFASSLQSLFSAVFLMGFSIGFMEAPLFSYIGEVTEPRIRGVLSATNNIFLNGGFIVINSLGALAEWRTVALISSGAPVVSLIAVLLIPESPAWLVSKGRVEEARRSYQWLRGWTSPQAVREELDALVAYVDQNRQNAAAKDSVVRVFLHPSVQRPLRLITVYFFVGACASLVAVKVFVLRVLADMEVPVRPNLALVLCTTMNLLGTVTCTLLMRRLGKRRLTFLSLSPSILCCLGLGIYLHLGLDCAWLPLALFCASYGAGGIGLMGIPWVLMSELFPLKGRGVACGAAGALGFLCYFFVTKTYFNIVSLVGPSGVYFLYAAVGVLGFVYLYLYLPETEGVPLESIERLFSNDIKYRDKPRPLDELNAKEEELQKL